MLFVVGFARTTHSPNAQGKKSLQTENIEKDTKIEVLDIQGRVLKTIHSISPKTEIALKDLAQGLYLLRVSNSTQNSAKTFIIQ